MLYKVSVLLKEKVSHFKFHVWYFKCERGLLHFGEKIFLKYLIWTQLGGGGFLIWLRLSLFL